MRRLPVWTQQDSFGELGGPKKAATLLEDWASSAVEVDGRACHIGGAI